MEKPERIILDESSNALDEKSEGTLWQIVREEKERRALILISCHTTETLEKEVPITYLLLETTDVGTAISQELLMGNLEPLQFYGRKIRTKRRESSYVSV